MSDNVCKLEFINKLNGVVSFENLEQYINNIFIFLYIYIFIHLFTYIYIFIIYLVIYLYLFIYFLVNFF